MSIRINELTGADAEAVGTLATENGAARDDLANVDPPTGRTALGLVIGDDVQPASANLAAFAGLTLVADVLPYGNGGGTLGLAAFTAFGRAMVGAEDAAEGRETLGLGTIATQPASAVAITGGAIGGLTSLDVVNAVTAGSVSSGGGITATGAITAGSTITVGAANSVSWGGARAKINSPSDGVVRFSNNANSNTVDLTVGGSNLATFNGPLTAGGTVTGSQFNSTGHFQAAAGGSFYWNGRTELAATSDGAIRIRDSMATNSVTLTVGASNLATFNGGVAASTQVLGPDGSATAPTLSFSNAPNTGFYRDTGGGRIRVAFNGSFTGVNFGMSTLAISSDTASVQLGTAADVVLTRDAANTLAQRNGTSAQAFRVYNTFTDTANYERGALEWTANVLRVGAFAAGTGTRRNLTLEGDSITIRSLAGSVANVWQWNNAGHYIASTDNTYDIGASGTNRPRNLYVAGTGTFGGTLTAPNVAAVSSTAALYFSDRTNTSLGRQWYVDGGITYLHTGSLILLRVSSTGALTTAEGITSGGSLVFSTDNAYDIGASGANRPRSLYLGSNITNGGTIVSSGSITTTGSLFVSKTAADASISLQANAGQLRYVAYQTAGSNRWIAGANTSAESGSNAGSNYFISRYSDAGSFLGNALTITRSSGNAAFEAAVAASSFIKPGSFTVSTVPSASAAGAGAAIYVSNESGGACLAFSDGTDWRRVGDRAVIS